MTVFAIVWLTWRHRGYDRTHGWRWPRVVVKCWRVQRNPECGHRGIITAERHWRGNRSAVEPPPEQRRWVVEFAGPSDEPPTWVPWS